MKENTIKFILFIIGASLFFLSQIFLLIQGTENFDFYRFKTDKIILERALFEEFSKEVYESINTQFSFYSITENCNQGDVFQLSLNVDTFYDCKKQFDTNLKQECRDNVVPNYTLCSDDGYQIDFENDKDYLNYEYRINFDPRLKCRYFSKSNDRKIFRILENNYICRNGPRYTYEKLLSDSFPLNAVINGVKNNCQGKYNCGILDTKNNILCLDQQCPNNIATELSPEQMKYFNKFTQYNEGKKIITSVIVSENQPMNHEWKDYVKGGNNPEFEKELKKRINLTKKDFGELVGEDDNTYENSGIEINLSNIIYNNPKSIIDSSKYNKDQKLNIYTRNYIGFKNLDELNKFKMHFNENDPKDNPLYQLCSSGHTPIITITFSSIFLLFDIIYILFLIINWKKENISNIFGLIICSYVINILYFVVALSFVIYHFCKYQKISIDMDDRMKKVLDLYNDRILSLQIYRIISLVFSFCSLIITSVKICKKGNENDGELIA